MDHDDRDPALAYLVNRYPSATHTFILREIQALEALGVPVRRYALRLDTATADDERWRDEARDVRPVLGLGAFGVARSVLWTAAADPARFASALRLALRLGWRSSRGMLLHLVYLAEACALLGMLREDGMRHVHVHFGTNAAVVALLCHRLGGPTWSFTAHGPEEFDDPKGLKLAAKVADASFTVAISDFGRSQLYRWARPEDWSRIHVVRCTVADAILEAGPSPVPDVRDLVTIGRLDNQKGQVLLVQAVGRLVQAGVDARLVVIGDGPLRDEIEAAIAATGHPEAFELRGWQPNDEVLRQLRAARALVLPSFAEGLPVVLMEALALGRPVVTTAIAGIPELVQDGRAGWVVPAGSIDALVEAMRRALETPVEELSEMGAEGARLVAAHHRASTEAARLRTLFPVTG